MDFKIAYDSFRREVLCNILIQFGIPTKLVRLITMCLNETCKLWVFENRVLRRIFGPKSDEVRGEWEKLHYEELNDLYSSCNIFWAINWRSMRWAEHVARVGVGRCVYRILVKKMVGCVGPRPLDFT